MVSRPQIGIKVTGDVKRFSEFALVKVTNRVAQTWEVSDNHEVGFRADRLEFVKTSA